MILGIAWRDKSVMFHGRSCRTKKSSRDCRSARRKRRERLAKKREFFFAGEAQKPDRKNSSGNGGWTPEPMGKNWVDGSFWNET